MSNIDYENELGQAIGRDESFTVAEEWEGLPGVAFGGFVVAGMFWAASRAADTLRPLSVHARFHAPVPICRPLQLKLEEQRKGRSIATYNASLFDRDRLLTSASIAFGKATNAEFRSQNTSPMSPLRDPQPTWKILQDAGAAPERITKLMRRVGHRRSPVLPDRDKNGGWHLENDWPATTSHNLFTRAAVAIMCSDAFVLPATMAASDLQPQNDWPVEMRSLDLATWFHDLESGTEEPQQSDDRLRIRTNVSVVQSGYALGRCEVWRHDRLVSESMSQVTLQLVPSSAQRIKEP